MDIADTALWTLSGKTLACLRPTRSAKKQQYSSGSKRPSDSLLRFPTPQHYSLGRADGRAWAPGDHPGHNKTPLGPLALPGLGGADPPPGPKGPA
eukprot:5481500-Lingulodinium_polyedra.AAC.1